MAIIKDTGNAYDLYLTALEVRILTRLAEARCTPALGRRAEDRFERAMADLGYDVWRYDAYTQIHHFLAPAQAQRVEAGLHGDYDPTALFWRNSPDYGVRPRGGGRCWMAEVKGPSPTYANLVLEATQLLNLYLLAQCLWLDIRYVYAAPDQPLRARSVEDVLGAVETVYINGTHPSAPTLRRLRRQTDVQWEERPNANKFDPYVMVPAAVLARWPVVLPAGLEAGDG